MRAVKGDTTPIHANETSKFRKLRTLIGSAETEFLMEAHNGISAKIAEEAGFKGIWASGLALSAPLAVTLPFEPAPAATLMRARPTCTPLFH
mgnify:CR=1 FL=1